jgi:anaerobic magnesium-protoporphyrin IX monomethyl ester cyclase
MKTILIYPQLEFANTQLATPPYSILFIADYLRKKNVDVEIFDLRFSSHSQLLNALAEDNINYIGISVMTGPQIHYALEISEIIKQEFKNIKIVWGGIHPTILPSQTLKVKLIDFVIRGEGEHSYYELINGKDPKKVKGLSLIYNDQIFHNPNSNKLSSSEINDLSIPWDLTNPKNYIVHNSLNMITSRGCPFQCNFCYNSIFNNIWRGWTAQKCIKEFNIVVDLGVKKINFYDDYFFANRERNEVLLQYFKDQDMTWKAELRVNQLTYAFADRLKECGCEQLFFGAESGSQRILNILGKNMLVKDIIQSAQITKDAEIFADYSWMIGIPGEEWDDIRKTIKLIKKISMINNDSEFSIKILFPYPKTEIHKKAVLHGFKNPKSLREWGEIRRERASDYLNNKNLLEMISLTSAIMGKKIFEQNTIPILNLIRIPASFRWKHEVFTMGIENLVFKIFRPLFEKIINQQRSIDYDQFSHDFVISRRKSD